MSRHARRWEGEPANRLTRLASAMVDTLESHAEYGDDVRCAVFLNTNERGGLVLNGYEDDSDAVVDLFAHLAAIFEANGRKLLVIPLGGDE